MIRKRFPGNISYEQIFILLQNRPDIAVIVNRKQHECRLNRLGRRMSDNERNMRVYPVSTDKKALSRLKQDRALLPVNAMFA